MFEISDSQVEGTLDSILRMTGLQHLDLSNNYLTGDIPIALMTNLSGITTNFGNNSIALNFLNVASVTDTGLISFLDAKFA